MFQLILKETGCVYNLATYGKNGHYDEYYSEAAPAD